MATFRKYGGLNYSANNNITASFISNASKTNINTVSGQPNSKEIFASHIDLSGNSILHTGTIYFMDGTSQNTAGISNQTSGSFDMMSSNVNQTSIFSTNASTNSWEYENISASAISNWNAFDWYFYTNNPTTFEKNITDDSGLDAFEVPSNSTGFILSSGMAVKRNIQLNIPDEITCNNNETENIWSFNVHVTNNQGQPIKTISTINACREGIFNCNLTFSLLNNSNLLPSPEIATLVCRRIS